MNLFLFYLLLWTTSPKEAIAVDKDNNTPKEGPVYVTATVLERERKTATSSVTVLSELEIRRSGARTAAELLRFAAGLQLTGESSRGGFATARLRGGDPNFTLVLLDGAPLNNPTYQVGGAFNLAGLPLSEIGRVEIVRGPFSSYYGSTGLAGVIHFITKGGQAQRLSPEFELEGGAGEQARASLSLAGSRGSKRYRLSAHYEQEQERIAAESFEGLQFFGSLDLALTRQRSLRFTSHFADWDSDDYPDASGGPLFGSGQLRQTENREFSFGLEHRFGTKRKQRLYLRYYHHEFDRTSPAIGFSVPPSEEDTRFNNARLGWQGAIYQTSHFEIRSGLDLTRENANNKSLLLLPPGFGGSTPGDYSQSRYHGGFFSEMTGQHGSFVWELASRFDIPEQTTTRWSPRLGASYSFENGTRLRASAGHAFKLPSFFAAFSPPALGGNPELRHETALGGDLGLEHQFQLWNLEIGITGFFNRFQDLVDFDFDTFLHVNRSKVEAKGLELTLDWHPSENWSFYLNTTRQDVRNTDTDEILRHNPKWSGGARLLWQPSQRLNFQLDALSSSHQRDQQIPINTLFKTSGYTLHGLTGLFDLKHHVQLRLRIENLTDKKYQTLIGFPGPDRGIRFSIRYKP